ncbi:MAG: acetyl-CoA carboxylase biotin carboxyl carrier protein [Phycisphaerae bacterium]|nr:acetyl-CoA carboxylase biotin carboxyl carrier protein [Phycisphaerae bacterium]
MEIQHIRDLIGLMKENELTEVRIIEGETRLLLKRGSAPVDAPMTLAPAMPAPLQIATPQAAAPAAAPAAKPAEEPGETINSPMVGTFYAAPSPDSEPFVRVGDHVHADTVVCIVEAMKVMNEIKAETSGTIQKVLVQNAQAVEFGQPLFQIKPD